MHFIGICVFIIALAAFPAACEVFLALLGALVKIVWFFVQIACIALFCVMVF